LPDGFYFPNTPGFTFIFWVKLFEVDQISISFIEGKQVGTKELFIGLENSKLDVKINDLGTTGKTSLEKDVWNYVAVTCNVDDDILRIYLGATLENTGNCNSLTGDKITSAKFGIRSSSGKKMKGILDEVMIFKDPLSVKELEEIKNDSYF